MRWPKHLYTRTPKNLHAWLGMLCIAGVAGYLFLYGIQNTVRASKGEPTYTMTAYVKHNARLHIQKSHPSRHKMWRQPFNTSRPHTSGKLKEIGQEMSLHDKKHGVKSITYNTHSHRLIVSYNDVNQTPAQNRYARHLYQVFNQKASEED